jgi:hypothetical protein
VGGWTRDDVYIFPPTTIDAAPPDPSCRRWASQAASEVLDWYDQKMLHYRYVKGAKIGEQE